MDIHTMITDKATID